MSDDPNDIAALHASLTPEDWKVIESWWRGTQHPGPYYVQPRIKNRPPRNSFTLPNDVINQLGNGDPRVAGMVLAGMFHLAPLADSGDPRVIDPDVVADIGHGSLAKGQKVLQRFVQMLRRQSRDYVVEQPDGNHGRIASRAL